jgi:hypothetical protein
VTHEHDEHFWSERSPGLSIVKRRLILSGAIALATGLAFRRASADQILTGMTNLASSDGGFRYIPEPGGPFSGGVAALSGHTLIRVRLREHLPFEQGLDLVARHLAGAGRQPSALAGLELRAPSVMTRPNFARFNARYLAALRARGFVTGQTVAVARSNMVPLYDPPKTDVLSAFTYAAPSDAGDAASAAAFLLSGRPEYDASHVIAPGDVSPDGMRRKAGFVMERLRQGVATLGGSWSNLTGVQIYMTEPLPSIMGVLRGAGLTTGGLSYFPGSTPVVGFGGVKYEFEADVRAIDLERVV